MRDGHTIRRPGAAAATALAATVVLVLGGCVAATDDGDRGRATNVILFIGDGMGAAQRGAGALASVGLDDELVMDDLPFAGLARTDSADPEDLVTDSAAGGTAYATGVKTYNGAIGVDAEGDEVETVLEQAEAAGLATGLVTSGEVTDATTAAFGAHVADREEQTEIARQFIEETGVDVILGGGEDFWYPAGDEGGLRGGKGRSGQGDLVRRAVDEFGYDHVSDAAGLAAAEDGPLLGLFANRTMFDPVPEPDGTNERRVSLADMTEKAIAILTADDDGFFLVVEEEAVDEQAHANNAEKTIEAVRLLDEAVAVGKSFAERRDDTLVIVTADHETGGMAIEDVDTGDESGERRLPDGETNTSTEDGPFDVADSDLRFTVDWTTGAHTDADVPVTAMGPGADRLTGYYENTFVHQVMVETLLGGD
jgi:alkaline phosphatase